VAVRPLLERRQGPFFGDSDVRAAAKVAVLGSTVADALFEGQDPVGQTVRIKNFPFRVIGVLETKGGNSMGQDQDDVVIAPYTTVMRAAQEDEPHRHVHGVRGLARRRRPGGGEIEALLRQRHRLGQGQDADFMIRSQPGDRGRPPTRRPETLSLLLASAASISLLVGGIGIMNIMLVSVTERTREIGSAWRSAPRAATSSRSS
jgi:putative ABC transport system permease protein